MVPDTEYVIEYTDLKRTGSSYDKTFIDGFSNCIIVGFYY